MSAPPAWPPAPHLHYEILVNNEQVNPANVKFKAGDPLTGKQLASFRQTVEKVQAQLDAMPAARVLSLWLIRLRA